MRRTYGLLAGLTLLGVAACSGPTSTPSPDTQTAPTSSAPTTPGTAGTPGTAAGPTDVITGLTTPWEVIDLATTGTGAGSDLLVAERDSGKILRVRGDQSSEVTTVAGVRTGSEGGLLGLALAPDRDQVFAYFTAEEDNRIVAMSWDGQRLGEPTEILTGIPKGGRHNGGRLAIGPDGFLYVGTGDAGNTGLAQDRGSLAGKILRLTLDGDPAPGNPFQDRIFSFGHRNPQGLAFDEDGRLWSSEFGENAYDELNLITAGANYGWPLVEGSGDRDGLTNPKVVWRTSEASPSGLAYAEGALWMAALRGEQLWRIPVEGTTTGEPQGRYVGDYGRLRSVTVADERLLVTTSNTDGRGDVQDGDDRILSVPIESAG